MGRYSVRGWLRLVIVRFMAACLLVACGSPSVSHGGSGDQTSCSAYYSAPSGEIFEADCDQTTLTCTCMTNGKATSTCKQAAGGCYPDPAPVTGVPQTCCKQVLPPTPPHS
jgi:hypothetical protein